MSGLNSNQNVRSRPRGRGRTENRRRTSSNPPLFGGILPIATTSPNTDGASSSIFPVFHPGQLVRVRRMTTAEMRYTYETDEIGWNDTLTKYMGHVGVIRRPTQYAAYWKVTFFFASSPTDQDDRRPEYDSAIRQMRWVLHGCHLEPVLGGIVPLLRGDVAVVLAENDRSDIDRLPPNWNDQLRRKLDGKAVVTTTQLQTDQVNYRPLSLSVDGVLRPTSGDFLIPPQLLVPLLTEKTTVYTRLRLTDIDPIPITVREELLIDLEPSSSAKKAFLAAILNDSVEDVIKHCNEFNDYMDIELDEEKGWTPLLWAIEHEKIFAVELLLLHGSRIDARHKQHIFPLEFAISKSTSVFERLLVASGDGGAHCRTADGGTLLHLTVLAGAKQHADLLLASQLVDANAQDANGLTAFHMAVGIEDVSLSAMLLGYGIVNAELADCRGDTPLITAIRRHNLKLVTLITETRPGVLSAVTNDGWTPLMVAAVGVNDYPIAKYLIGKCDVNARTATDGRTLLAMLLDPKLCPCAESVLLTKCDVRMTIGEQPNHTLVNYLRLLKLFVLECDVNASDASTGYTVMHIVLAALATFQQRRGAALQLNRVVETFQGETSLHHLVEVSAEAPQLGVGCWLALHGSHLSSPNAVDGRTPEQLLSHDRRLRTALLLLKEYARLGEQKGGCRGENSSISSGSPIPLSENDEPIQHTASKTEVAEHACCVWCQEQPPSVRYQPCGHKLLCLDCAQEPMSLPKCLSCKQEIKAKIDADGNLVVVKELPIVVQYKQLEQKMEEFTSCPICCEPYADSSRFVLDCGHVCCAACLDGLRRRDARCHLCRRLFHQPRLTYPA